LTKVLITGGLGFIGSYTADALRKQGYKIKILDSLEQQAHNGKKPAWANNKDETIIGDISEIGTWEKALADVDYIVHLAGVVGISQSMYQPARYIYVNSVGTTNMYEVLLKDKNIRKRIKKIVAASSKTIYGEGSYLCKTHKVVFPGMRSQEQLEKKQWEVKCPHCGVETKPVGITEDKPPQNLSVYALSKYGVERLAEMYADTLGVPTITFRYFSAYGPRQSLSNPYSGVCAIFISRVKNGNGPTVFEDGQQIRDFVYVEDIAGANVLAIKKEKVERGIFNIASGVGTSILDVGQTITRIMDPKIKTKVTEKFRVGDTRSDFADISKAREELGFQPRWTLKKGLEELVRWSEKQKAEDRFSESEAERKKYFST
jgi:dTDP-L-rhamnose 4-epimerase